MVLDLIKIVTTVLNLACATFFVRYALRAEKTRQYYEEQAGKATEVLNLIAKLWGAAKEAQDEEV